jgi:hypothetical protein
MILDPVTGFLLLANGILFGCLCTDWRNRYKDANLLKSAHADINRVTGEVNTVVGNIVNQLKTLTDKVNAHEISIGMKK